MPLIVAGGEGRTQLRSTLTTRALPYDNSGMDDKPTMRGGGAVAIVLIAVLILLPILYVLSVGPVVWLDSHDALSEPMHSVAGIIYFPLGWVVNNEVPIFGPALRAYVEWWD